jgi:hypothetical protein
LKYSSSGVQQWAAIYNDAANGIDSAFVVQVAPNTGNVYVTGSSYGTPSSGYDIVTVKYSQPVSVNNHNSNLPVKFELYQNYPNPFNPKTIINYDLPKDSYVKIKVTDMLGREVATLVNQPMKAGENKVEFDGSNYPSGVYFYKLQAGDFTQTKKLILLK